jgi:hypothetical protein
LDKLKYLNDDDENDECNSVVVPHLRESIDYTIVNADVWNFFHSRYGGIMIKRYYIPYYSHYTQVEVNLKEVFLLCNFLDLNRSYP